MKSIILEDGEYVEKGNFGFIYDKTKSESLFEKFLDFESIFKLSYIDFAHKLRMAYEAFALQEETERRSLFLGNVGKSVMQIKEEIIQEIVNPSSPFNYKKILIRLTRENASSYIPMLRKYNFWKPTSDDYDGGRALKKYIQFVYNFASKSSHVNNQIEDKYIPNKENCLNVIESFHDFLCIYYGVKHEFNASLMPIREYYAVSQHVCDKIGLRLEEENALFVKEKNGIIGYFIFSSDIESVSLHQRRAIDTINKLWEDNYDDPSNIIRQTERISGTNMDYKYQVYSLPGRPFKLVDSFIKGLSIEDKMDIIKGICNGINSMHSYIPAFYHRNINPEAFYIFKVQNKYKALLARFDCTKDTGGNVAFTVFANVTDNIKDGEKNKFFAPELVDKDINDKVDWEKADIYSLGKTCIYILTGKVVDDTNEIRSILRNIGIKEKLVDLIANMIDRNVSNRPTIYEILDNI